MFMLKNCNKIKTKKLMNLSKISQSYNKKMKDTNKICNNQQKKRQKHLNYLNK